MDVKTQSVVLMTEAFTGMELFAQTAVQFHKVKMDTAALAVVSVSMCSELGPVLTGLMVAGRVGAAVAAEIGTMRVTEQIDALRTLATPEMLSYFSEQLSDQASQGARNEVSDVRLLQGDLAQAWREGNREYATVAMRFSMIDVTRDTSGRVVDGSLLEHVTATELWTFVRSSGGQWILSAIQQAR